MLASRETYGRYHALNTLNPSLNSEQLSCLKNINAHPENMWNIFDEEVRNGESWIEPLSEDGVVNAIFPTNQYVPNGGDNAHYMISFRQRDRFATPGNIDDQHMAIAAGHIQHNLAMSENAFSCYNISHGPYGQPSWKSPAQSWDNMHIHCLNIEDKALIPLQRRNLKQVEPGNDLRLQYFRQTAESMKYIYPQEMGMLNQVNLFDNPHIQPGRYNPNGLAFSIGTDITAGEFGGLLKDIDTVAQIMHRDIYSTCVDNYEEVEQSGWTAEYHLRPEEEFQNMIFCSDPLEQVFLNKTRKAIEYGTQAQDPSDRIYKSPCYSVAFWQQRSATSDQDEYVFVVDPHSFRKNGGLECVGITLNRRNTPNAPIDYRIQKSWNVFNQARSM